MRIAYLEEQLLSLNGLKEAFQTIYPNARIEGIQAQKIDEKSLGAFDILILPGCNGEDSPYPEILTPSRINALNHAMQNNGMVLVAFCAAPYYLSEKITYETRDGRKKIMDGCGLFKGEAYQAFAHVTRLPNKNREILKDYIEAELTSPMSSFPLKVLNINGPAFRLDTAENCNIFLQYKETQGSAGFSKNIGKGKLIALGVHPELSCANSDRDLSGLFSQHEKDRFTVLKMIRHIIDTHRFGITYTQHPSHNYA